MAACGIPFAAHNHYKMSIWEADPAPLTAGVTDGSEAAAAVVVDEEPAAEPEPPVKAAVQIHPVKEAAVFVVSTDGARVK